MNQKSSIRRANLPELVLAPLISVSVNLYVSFTGYFSYYLTGIVGVGILLASSFITIFRIWDAFTDVGMGVIVDQTNTRFGKFRPYIMVGTIGSVLTSWLLINVPAALPEQTNLRFTVYVLIYLFFVLCTTMQACAVRSLPQLLTEDTRQRATIGMITGIFLTLLYSAVPVLVFSHIMPQTKGFNLQFFRELWKYVALFSTVFAGCTLFVYRTKDVYQEIPAKNTQQRFVWWDALQVLRHNRPMQMLILSAGTDKLATVCQTNATIVVIIYAIVAGNSKLSSAAASYTVIPSILMILLGLGGIGRRYGAKKSMVIASFGGMVVCLCSILLWILGEPRTLSFPGFEGYQGWTFFTIAYLLLWCLMKGFGMVSTNVLNPMLADVIDYETYRSGNYCPGLIGSLFNLADKVISSLGPTIIGILCALIGFKGQLPTIDTPYSVPLFAVGVLGMYGLVLIGLVVNLVALRFYDLTPERMAEIHAALESEK